MYSSKTVIHESDSFTVTSYGNGAAYAIETPTHSLFLQGDDAAQFRDELDAREQARPDMLTADILAELWGEYASAAQPKE